MTNWMKLGLVSALAALAALPARAQEAAAEATETAAEVVTEVAALAPYVYEKAVDKGDVAWMSVATVLVLLMTIPGLALFYGGLVRTKNMLSVLTQVFAITCVVAIIWVTYGYSLAFTYGGSLDSYVAVSRRRSLPGSIRPRLCPPSRTGCGFRNTRSSPFR